MDVALLLHWFLGLEETATSNGLIVYRMLHHFGHQEPESWINREGIMGQTFGYFESRGHGVMNRTLPWCGMRCPGMLPGKLSSTLP